MMSDRLSVTLICRNIETGEQYEWALGRTEALANDVTEEMPDNDP